MTTATLLPPSVQTVVIEFLRLAEKEQLPLLGLYLVGSVALDDFRLGSSDIDFVAVLDDELTAEECDALALIHNELAEVGGPCFDGFYLPTAILKRPPRSYAALPFSLDGRFRNGEVCREINPVVWRCLARHGRTVVGPPPSALGIADDGELLRAYQVSNLQTYWLPWIDQTETALAAKASDEDCNAAALAWGVLGVARISCSLATDQVVSKRCGGFHALNNHPNRWHPIIREALLAHGGNTTRVSVAIVREGLDYMRFAICHSHDRAA